MFKASFFILNSPPFYPIRQMSPLDFFHGYAPITHPVKRLLHKGKFTSQNKMCRLTRQYITFHSTICAISPRKKHQIAQQLIKENEVKSKLV